MRTRRAPRPLLALLALALGSSGVLACSSDGSEGAGPTTTAAGPTGATTLETPAAGAPFPVGRQDLTLVDPTRGTDAVPGAGVDASDDRTVEVSVFYPAEAEPQERAAVLATWDHSGKEPVASVAAVDAPPAEGPFGLLVFAHGFGGQGSSFVTLAEQWAREGWVVALPTFPLSRNGVNNTEDYRNQPADLSFVIDQFAAPDKTVDAMPAPLAAGLVDPGRIAVGGHSLGGATVLRASYNSCCTDPRIRSVIEVSGGPLDIGEPCYADQPDTPLLIIHGEADGLVKPVVAQVVADLITAPTEILRITAGDHVSVFVGEAGQLLSDAVLAHLARTVDDDPSRWEAFVENLPATGLGTLGEG